MAVRISADASVFKRTASVPLSTSFTLAGWFRFVTAAPARFWGAMGMMTAVDGVSGRTIASTTSGGAQLALEYTNAGGTFVTDALLTVAAGPWYFIAITGSGNAIGNLAAYIRAQHEKAFTSVTNSVAGNSFAAGAIEFGREGFTGEFMDGDAFGLCAFDTPLSSRELMLLSNDLLAEQAFARARPNVYYRLRGNNDIWDRSGNARHATVTAGLDRPGIRVSPRLPQVLSNPSTAITGILAQTLGALVSAAQGAVDVAGTLVKTLDALLSSGAGTVNVDGSLAQTLGALTVAGVGSVGSNIDGGLAKTLGALTSGGTGTVNVDGQGAVTLGALTSVGAGAVNVDGTLVKTLGPLVVAGVGDNGTGTTPTDGYTSIEWRRRGRR